MADMFTVEQLESLLEACLQRAGVSREAQPMREREAKQVFNVFFEDYLAYHLSVDTMSSLCEQLSNRLMIDEALTTFRGTDILGILLLGAEISWYIRNDPPKAADLLEEVRAFHKRQQP